MTQYRLPRLAAQTPPPPLGEPVRIASASAQCEGDVRAVFDGDEGSRWECPQLAPGSSLTLDLGRSVAVEGVMYSQGAYSRSVPVQLAIDTSMDAVTWVPARDGSVLGALIEGGLRHPRSLRAELPFPAREARFVRLRPVAPAGPFAWLVAEVEVRASD